MDNLNDFLAQIDAQLSGAKPPPVIVEFREQPVMRKVVFFEFLEDESRKKTKNTLYVHLFEPISWDTLPNPLQIPDTHAVVLHGHGEDSGCSSPTFCHELSYRPTGEPGNKLNKFFYQKWSNYGHGSTVSDLRGLSTTPSGDSKTGKTAKDQRVFRFSPFDNVG